MHLRQEAWQAAANELLAARATFAERARLKPYVPLLEVDAALAVVDLHKGRYMSALERANGAVFRLSQQHIRNLYRPTMTALFAAQVLIANGEADRARQLAQAMRAALARTLAWLDQHGGREAFLRQIWYNAELFSLIREQPSSP